MSVEIPLVGRYGWEPAPATDLSNIFLNCESMEIEGVLVTFNVETGVAGKPSTRVIDNVVQLEIVEEKSIFGAGLTEVFAEVSV